jgi:hypothetical protein
MNQLLRLVTTWMLALTMRLTPNPMTRQLMVMS